jgi:hypothetical protein
MNTTSLPPSYTDSYERVDLTDAAVQIDLYMSVWLSFCPLSS